MDFSENFTIAYQDEIQSAHWAQQQVTVYTINLWNRDSKHPWVITSDTRDHEKNTVAGFTTTVLDWVASEWPHVDTVSIWTDGPSSQYKNRFIMALLSMKIQQRYQFSVSWNYFATSHGKGPNDALGGTAKRMVHERIMSRNVTVNSAESFANVLGSMANGFSVTYVSSEDIAKLGKELACAQLWESSAIIQGMHNIHYVEPTESGVLTKFYTSSTKTRIQPVNKKCPQKAITTPVTTKGKKTNRKQVESDKCKVCSWIYGDPKDPLSNDEWIQCTKCSKWFHESCAEADGIIDDDGFTCYACC